MPSKTQPVCVTARARSASARVTRWGPAVMCSRFSAFGTWPCCRRASAAMDSGSVRVGQGSRCAQLIRRTPSYLHRCSTVLSPARGQPSVACHFPISSVRGAAGNYTRVVGLRAALGERRFGLPLATTVPLRVARHPTAHRSGQCFLSPTCTTGSRTSLYG